MAGGIRIYVQKDHHPHYQRLSQGPAAPYDQLTDVFVAAATLGYREGTKSPSQGGTQHAGWWHSLKTDSDIPLLQAIAVADTGEISVIGDSQQVLAIAMEYANVGIGLLLHLEGAEVEDSISRISLDALRNRP